MALAPSLTLENPAADDGCDTFGTVRWLTAENAGVTVTVEAGVSAGGLGGVAVEITRPAGGGRTVFCSKPGTLDRWLDITPTWFTDA